MATKKTAQPAKKNPAAQSLSRLRWNKPEWRDPEARSQFARTVSLAGWSGEAAERRRHQGGRPPDPDRCPCGAMTRKRAAQRNHRCVAQPKKKIA
jgi:hypothetical protein